MVSDKSGLMNGNEFSPNDNRADKYNKSKVIFRFLFVTNWQFSKAFHKRMRHFHAPAFGFKIGIALQFLLFFSAMKFRVQFPYAFDDYGGRSLFPTFGASIITHGERTRKGKGRVVSAPSSQADFHIIEIRANPKRNSAPKMCLESASNTVFTTAAKSPMKLEADGTRFCLDRQFSL